MIREALAYLLLAAMFIGSLFNISYADRTFSELEDSARQALVLAERGDFDEAEKILSSACDKWIKLDTYTHIFFKHTEIDSATDAFFDMLSDIYDKNEKAARGSFRKLAAHLDSLIGAERLTIGSIF